MIVHIVLLTYDVHFNDADNGDCYAGDGARVIKAFADEKKAEEFVAKWLPIIQEANKETVVFPTQANSRKMKKELGFTIHDFAQAEENYGLAIHEEEIEEADAGVAAKPEDVLGFGAFEFIDGFMHPNCVDLMSTKEKRRRAAASSDRREPGALLRVYAPNRAPAGSVCLICKKGIT